MLDFFKKEYTCFIISKGEICMKKLGILFSTIIMVMLFAVSVSALPSSGSCGTNVTYTYDYYAGKVIISGMGDMSYAGDYSPFRSEDIYTVIINNGVTSIGRSAFYNCEKLRSVTIPESVVLIDYASFAYCTSLKNITIPYGVSAIGALAFSYCSNLKSVTIPGSLTSISNGAFRDCPSLTDVYYCGTEEQWEKINVGVNNEALTNANIHYVIEIGNCGDNVTYLLCKDGELVIRGSGPMYDYNSSNKPSPFRKTKSINNVIVENGVSSIGAYAFYCRSNLTSIDIAETVTSISDSAFSGCENLLEITIPDNVVSIGNSAFYGCYSLKKITIPNGVTSIGNNAFALCKNLTSINVDADNAYYHSDEYGILFNKDQTTLIQCPIKIATSYYEMPNSVITIKEGAFFCCESLKGIKLSNNVTTISEEAFYFSFLEEIVIPSGVTTIGGWAFSSCEKLNFIELPNTLTTIEDGAFSYSALKNIIIPQSVTSIGKSVFEHCEGLEKIVVEEGNEHYVADVCGVLYNIEKTVLMHYPSASTNSEYVIPDKVAIIDSYAFGRCESLNKLTIPLNCKIMNYAFNYTISDVYYPGTLKEYLNTYSNIPHYSLHCSDGTYNGYKGVYDETIIWVFDYITGTLYLSGNGEIKDNYWYNYPVKDIIIGDGVSSIECMFYDCEELETVTISESVAYIMDISFASCKNLKKITVDEDNKYYSNDEYGVLFDKNKTVLYAYPPASSMKSYTIPNGVKRIVEISFSYCKNLKNVVLPDSLTKIDQAAFENCTSLETIMIPDTVAIIYQSYYCENLTDVFYEGSEEQWNAIEIYDWSNNSLINAKKHFNHSHKFTIEVVEEATHLKEGKGIYSCECGYIYTGAIDKLEDHAYTPEVTKEATHLIEGTLTYTCECGASYTEPIAKLEGHTYTSEVTKESTHLEEGEKTYTCECGDSYTKPITKLEGHTYTSEITKEATHLEEGTLTYTCECGDSYTEPIAKLEGHTYISEVTKEATHIEEGVLTYSCECGDSYTESIEKIEKHTYIANVIAPTCSEKGYTLNVCECGDSYISDYVGMIAHSYVYSVIKSSSHLVKGLGRYTCSKCGDHYDEAIAKTKEHSYTATLVNSTCINQGYTLNQCECGESFKSDYLAKTDHNDSNADGVCDNCGYELTANCSCNCHAGGIKGLIFKLILFFQKLFRTNQICEGCGVRHY